VAFDEAKAKAMRGEPAPADEPEEEKTGGEPTPAELAACRRVLAAISANDPRALCAALKDVDDDDYEPGEEE
jgi:hypothetical protein